MEKDKQMFIQLEERKNSLDDKEKNLKIAQQKLEDEKVKYTEESRKKLEENANNYVSEALKLLKDKEESFHLRSTLWSLVGGLSILVGIISLLYFGNKGLELIDATKQLSWEYLFFITFKGLIVIGLLISLAKYAYTYSQSYMHESVKNSERRHAINFGKFYLESYGSNANWEQVKDAFENWNIVSDSAFSKPESNSFDPKSIEGAISLIDAVSKLNILKNKEV